MKLSDFKAIVYLTMLHEVKENTFVMSEKITNVTDIKGGAKAPNRNFINRKYINRNEKIPLEKLSSKI